MEMLVFDKDWSTQEMEKVVENVTGKKMYIKTPFWDSLHFGRIESFKPLELSYVRTTNKTFFDYEIKEGRRFVKKTKIVEGKIKFRPTIHNLYCWVKDYNPEV